MSEDFWPQWSAMYEAHGVKQFVRDGSGPAYESASRRVMFVLKEPHGTQWKDVREQLAKPPRGMWHALARWAYGILKGGPAGFPAYGVIGATEQQWALQRIAVINIKKEGGGRKADDSVLHAVAHRDREILQDQVATIAPQIVIACGTFNQLVWLLDLEPESDPRRSPRVVSFRHPAQSHGPKDYGRLEKLVSPLLT